MALVYTLGILASFWVIVAVLLVLRAGGSQAGWGFQLQSPAFLAVLALGLFFFSMSLAGQFEIGLSITSAGDSLTRKQGYTGSFFTGVLATVVATPCTAPLMGAAIGFALAQPAWITFAVFTALGLGLAFPYLLLTLAAGVDALAAATGRLDGDAEAADGGAAVCDGDLADVGVWAAVFGRRCRGGAGQ